MQPPAPEPDVDLKDVGLEEGDAAKFRCGAGLMRRVAYARAASWPVQQQLAPARALSAPDTQAALSGLHGAGLPSAGHRRCCLQLPDQPASAQPGLPPPTHTRPAGRRRTCGAARCSRVWWSLGRAASGRARETWCGGRSTVCRQRGLHCIRENCASQLLSLLFTAVSPRFFSLLPSTACCHPTPVQVFLHYSLSDASGDVLLSTRAEHGGAGRPQPFVLGRGRRMLRGMELGVTGAPLLGAAGCVLGWCSVASLLVDALHTLLATPRPSPPTVCAPPPPLSPLPAPCAEMARGERAVLDIQPPYAFLHADSGLPRPPGLRPEARISADVTVGGPSGGSWGRVGYNLDMSTPSPLLALIPPPPFSHPATSVRSSRTGSRAAARAAPSAWAQTAPPFCARYAPGRAGSRRGRLSMWCCTPLRAWPPPLAASRRGSPTLAALRASRWPARWARGSCRQAWKRLWEP